MVQRVIMGSSGGSPLRISVAGVDASTAQFNNLIFDGNQPPLRLALVGSVSCVPLIFGNVDSAVFQDVSIPATPSGTSPIYLACTRQLGLTGGTGDTNGLNQVPHRFYTGGGTGAGLFQIGGNNVFTALNFNRDNSAGGVYGYQSNGPTGGVPIAGVFNYCIFQNFQ